MTARTLSPSDDRNQAEAVLEVAPTDESHVRVDPFRRSPSWSGFDGKYATVPAPGSADREDASRPEVTGGDGGEGAVCIERCPRGVADRPRPGGGPVRRGRGRERLRGPHNGNRGAELRTPTCRGDAGREEAARRVHAHLLHGRDVRPVH